MACPIGCLQTDMVGCINPKVLMLQLHAFAMHTIHQSVRRQKRKNENRSCYRTLPVINFVERFVQGSVNLKTGRKLSRLSWAMPISARRWMCTPKWKSGLRKRQLFNCKALCSSNETPIQFKPRLHTRPGLFCSLDRIQYLCNNIARVQTQLVG